MWILYETLFLIGLLLYLPKAVWRKRLPHQGWVMRLGRYPSSLKERLSDRQTIWVHAVSVGEVLAVRPLLRRLAQTYPDQPLVLSAITPSGYQLAATQVDHDGVAIYFPLDLRWCVRRALNTLRPRMLLLVDSELWPLTIHLTKARGVPVVVVNGRISPRTFRRALWFKPWVAPMLAKVDLFLMQSQVDADRLHQLGVPAEKVRVVQSLKWDASVHTRPTSQDLQETAARIGIQPHETIIVAGSTHRGEETAVLHAFHAWRGAGKTARLIIAPRHLERLTEVEALIRNAGYASVRFSQGISTSRWDVGLVDTFGQLPRYYGLATIVFVGGSLIPHGGQNPLEAASLGKPILFGPFMHNFADIAQQLTTNRAARQLSNAAECTSALHALLANPVDAQAMGRRAQELTTRCQGATQRTLDALTLLLSRIS